MTQDVGSDPTVRGFIDSHVFCCCCVLCGMELGEEEGEEEEEEEEGRLEGDGEEHEKGMNVTVFDLSEMSRMEDEDGDEEMGGEPDTTSDDMTSHYHDAEKGDVARGERNAHPNTNSERKTFLTTLG